MENKPIRPLSPGYVLAVLAVGALITLITGSVVVWIPIGVATAVFPLIAAAVAAAREER